MKRLLTLLLAVCLVLSLGACTPANPDNTDPGNQPPASYNEDYVVLVVDQFGAVISNAFIGVTPTDDPNTPAASPAKTNSYGIATFNLDNSKTYKAGILATISGYTVDTVTKTAFGTNKVAIITVQKDAVPVAKNYTIIVVDQNGDPVQGITVQACIPGGVCTPFSATNAGGSSVNQIVDENNEYKAQITGAPGDYTYSKDYVDFDSNGVAIIKVTKN